MLTLALLSLAAHATPQAEACEDAFFERLFPEGAPHRPPPLRPLLEFAWDIDGSGALEAGEREALDRDMTLRCAALEAIAAELDADGDGTIQATERDEGLRSLFGPPPPPPPRRGPPKRGTLPPPLVHAFDTDGDQVLSPEEEKSARTEVRDRLRNGLPPIPPPEHSR